MAIRKREDWILLALALARGRGHRIDDLHQRLAGLRADCSNEVGPAFYRFTWATSGPASDELDADLERLAHAGMLEYHHGDGDPGSPAFVRLTLKGLARALSLNRLASPDARDALQKRPASVDALAHW